MKEETVPKAKNQFQLELEAKMKDRRSRGLTSALSPSPTDLNQGSLVISDDEDDILTSLQRKSTNKSKWNPSPLNETMQWGDSQYWNHSLLNKDDKIHDPLDFRNKKSPSLKESPRSGDGQKRFLKSQLSPRNNSEIDSLQIQNSPRSFREVPNKLDIKNSPRGDFKPERKKLSYSDHVDDSPRSTGSVIDQSLSSVSDAHNATSSSSGQRFLKSSKKVKSVSIEKDEEKNIQDEIDSPRPVPRARKKSVTPPQHVQTQDLQMEENNRNNDSDSQNSVRSSARMRRQATKANNPSPASLDNLNLSSGKNSPSTIDTKMRQSPKSPKSPKDKDISLKETEKLKSMRNKNSLDVKDVNQNKNDSESNEKKTKKERQGKSASLDKQSPRKVGIANDTNSKTSLENKSTEEKSSDKKPSFSRRGSLRTPNKFNENKSNSANQVKSPQNRSSVFDFLSEDNVEPKTSIQKQKSPENKEESSLFFTQGDNLAADSVNFDKDTSSLCEESMTELLPKPIPRRNKNQRTSEVKTEREIFEEAIKQVEDCQNSEVLPSSNRTHKNTDSLNKSVMKPKPTARKSFKNLGDISDVMLDTTVLREETFKEWKIQKNRIIKEEKKKKIEEEEKKKKELEEKKMNAVLCFESWKKQKEPILKQKFKREKTKLEEEFEKKQELLEKKQKSAELFEVWKKDKDEKLKKEISKKKEEEQKKNKLLSTSKEEKQKDNVTSFNTWKETKDKVLLQKKKEELKTTKLIQRQQNFVKIQKETMSDESYQQWLWRKEEQEKQELKKKKRGLHLENSYGTRPLQAWRPPSRTIPC